MDDRPLFLFGIYLRKYFIRTLRVLIINPKIELGSATYSTNPTSKERIHSSKEKKEATDML